jgi:hypothetical protein
VLEPGVRPQSAHPAAARFLAAERMSIKSSLNCSPAKVKHPAILSI